MNCAYACYNSNKGGKKKRGRKREGLKMKREVQKD